MKFVIYLCIVCISVLTGYAQTGNDNLIRGADLSTAPQIMNAGGTWKVNGVPGEILDIFKTSGANYVRLRLWYSPSNGYCGLDSTLAFALKIKSRGLKLLLNFHYSDVWADPAHQTKPAAWNGLSFSHLKDSVYSYTKRVITALKNQNTIPDMVQVGNEITDGMLWPDGKISTNGWTNFTTLLKAGIQGVKDAVDTVKIMIHIDRGGDNGASRWYFDNLISNNVNYDLIGLSYYPWWHGSFTDLRNNLNDIAVRYNKDIVIVETAYPWTSEYVNDGVPNVGYDSTKLPAGYPVIPQGQYDFLKYLSALIKSTTNNKGIGFCYWEPAYISIPPVGSSWENYCLFDFNGNAFNSLNIFITDADEKRESIPDKFQLYQNYPNPFNPSTTIGYQLPASGHVTIKVYDVFGSEVKTLVNQIMPGGVHEISFDASQISSGIYLYRMSSGNTILAQKMICVK